MTIRHPRSLTRLVSCALAAAAAVCSYSNSALSAAESGGTTLVTDVVSWTIVTPQSGKPHGREECAFVESGGRLYLLGGRGIKPVDIYDPKTRTWSEGAPPPVEVHHFQAVVWDGRIIVACAMTGGFPRERPLDKILVYDPRADVWSWGDTIPAERRRGYPGTVIHEGKLHLVSGIINGHTDGWVTWCDSYDLKTGQWAVLPDAPRARDHFEAALVDGKIYVAGGRRSSAVTKQVFDLTVPEVDVYDIVTSTWTTLPPASNLPTLRAGTTTIVLGHEVLVIGGESMTQTVAHADVEALDTRTGRWRTLAPLQQGRHGTSVARVGNALYICAGAGNRGGSPLLESLEMLRIGSEIR